MRKLAISLGDKHALPREEFIPSYSGAGSIADTEGAQSAK
jgi:hypothetical protein